MMKGDGLVALRRGLRLLPADAYPLRPLPAQRRAAAAAAGLAFSGPALAAGSASEGDNAGAGRRPGSHGCRGDRPGDRRHRSAVLRTGCQTAGGPDVRLGRPQPLPAAGRLCRGAVPRSLSGQLTALRYSSAMRRSFSSFSSLIANEVGHIVPSSRLARSSITSAALRVSHFDFAWNKQITLPALFA